MQKVAIRNKDHWEDWVSSWPKNHRVERFPSMMEPESYPCLLIYYIWDNPNGPYEITWDAFYVEEARELLEQVEEE